MQIHILRFMAIGTTDRIHNLRSHCRPFALIEIIYSYRLHHTGNVRTLTSPASCRLRTFIGRHRSTDTQGMTHIVNRMHMTAWSRIIFRKSISGPKNNHFGTGCQHIDHLVSVILALKTGIHRLRPGFIFPRIVRGKLFVYRLNAGNLDFLVIHHTGNLGPPFIDRGSEYAQYENNGHCPAEQQPALP